MESLEKAAARLSQANLELFYRGEGLSIRKHPAAIAFKEFIEPYLDGEILDVGCGPQPIPLYLRGYPKDLISGLDPLSSFMGHPFQFREGRAESIPWGHEAFDVVITAISLAHTLYPSDAIAEIWRVLRPSGTYLCWEDFHMGAAEWDPKNFTAPADDFHLFHFDYGWFLSLICDSFELLGRQDIGSYVKGRSRASFFAFRKDHKLLGQEAVQY